jgi:hypothetical protein
MLTNSPRRLIWGWEKAENRRLVMITNVLAETRNPQKNNSEIKIASCNYGAFARAVEHNLCCLRVRRRERVVGDKLKREKLRETFSLQH